MTQPPYGKKARLWSPPDSFDLPALPVREVTGGQPGPHLCVTAGVHGDEYEGPAALEAWYAAFDPDRLSGRVTLLPVINVGAWNARQRRTPADDADLNRAFPGEPDGGPTARLAHAVWTTFIEPADAVIDLHSGGFALQHLPLAGVYADAPASARKLVAAFDHRFWPWLIPDAPGVLSREAHRAGKPAIGVEWGGGGTIDPAGVDAITDALNRSLVQLGMTEGSAWSEKSEPRAIMAGDYEVAPATGIFQPRVKLGDTVSSGEILGSLTNPLTNTRSEVIAPRSGRIGGLPHHAWVEKGERILYLG